MTSIEKQLRDAAHASGLTRADIAAQARIAYSAVHGFMAGKRTLTLATADRLCELLGLELRPKRRKKGRA